ISVVAFPIGYNYDTAEQNGDVCLSGDFVNSARQAVLALDVIAANGTTVLGTATAAGLGSPAMLGPVQVPAGDCYVRARSTSSSSPESQLHSLQLTAGAPPPPVNDNCSNAIRLITGALTSATNIGATNEGTASCVPNTDNDLWYFVGAECGGRV